jgi:hypothetical protein
MSDMTQKMKDELDDIKQAIILVDRKLSDLGELSIDNIDTMMKIMQHKMRLLDKKTQILEKMI